MIFFAAADPEGNCHEKCQQLGDGNGKPDAVRAEPQRKRYNGDDLKNTDWRREITEEMKPLFSAVKNAEPYMQKPFRRKEKEKNRKPRTVSVAKVSS